MSFPIQNANQSNPVTGVFGNGQIQLFLQTGVFTVPLNVLRVRVRIWGGGGANQGGGGGFAMKVCNVTPAQVIGVTVGGSSQASSFGSFASATAGATSSVGGTGVGGDVNYQGGTGGGAGGGAANIFGNGGNQNSSGASGGGQSNSGLQSGGSGFGSTGGFQNSVTNDPKYPPTTLPISSIDFIGTGGGGGYNQHGVNGGGDGAGMTGGVASFPAAGGATSGGKGLVILEY
jgi:hypothetical protein